VRDAAQRPELGSNDAVRLKRESSERNTALHKLDAQLRSCRDLASARGNSTSWKMAAPLRTIVATLRRVMTGKRPD
jgi:hypothetical protein